MGSARIAFWEWVTEAFRRRKVKNDLAVEDYLVELLEKFMKQEDEASVLSEPLLIELQKCLARGDIAKFARVRRIGDASLFTAGVLGPHLTRSLVGIKHYVEVGESAYKILLMSLDANSNLSLVYREFARDLGPFVRVLNEVSVSHVFPPNLDDILTVYKRYSDPKTRTEADRRWLLERGVVLLDGPDPTKLILQ